MIKTAATLLCFTSFAMTSPRHGYATFGELLYPADFERFSYTLDNPYEGGELHLAELGTFDSFNPFILRGQTPSYAFLLNKVYATLLAPAKDEPASSYAYVAKSIDLDEKSKWCDFHLNEMAVFSDGSAITAHDVVFSFTILVEKGLPQFKAYYQHIVKAEALDDYTVRFHFNETKNRELPLIVGQLPILSKKYYETHAFDAPSLEKAPTSGPYVIEKCEPGRLLSYKKVKNWWGKEVASQKNQHNYELITVYYFRDNNTMFEAFKSGQVDFRMENVSKQWATEYTFDAVKRGDIVRLELANTMSSLTVGYFMNLRRHTFKDPLVRKGISILLDFEWLKKNIFYNLYDRNNSYFPKSEFDSSKGLNEKSLALLKDLKRTYPDDVSDDVFKEPDIFPVLKSEEDTRLTIQKAQELFKKAGYELKDGVLVKDGKPFSFEVLLKDKIYERFTLNFVNLLKKAGIQVGIRLVDTATYFERIESYEFDMIYEAIAQSPTPGNELRDYFGSKAALQPGDFNYAGISNKAIDDLINRIDESESYEELKSYVKALDRLLLYTYAMVPSWYTPKLNVAFWNKFDVPKNFPAYQPYDVTGWALDPSKKLQKSDGFIRKIVKKIKDVFTY